MLILGGIRQVRAETPTNVGLLYFTATPQTDGVRLDWKTESELGTAGFIIKRAAGSDTTFVTLNDIGFIASQGGVATGATYSRVDDTAVYGQSYSYKLVEIETDSSETDLETVAVTFLIEPTATPVVVGGGGNSTTTAPTNTPVPTSTPQPTATAAATAAATATAVSSTANAATSAAASPTATTIPASPTATIAANSPAGSTATATPTADTSQPPPDAAVAFAQEPGATAYPAPPTPEPIATDAAYPVGQPPSPAPAEPAVNPPVNNAVPSPTIAVIGSQTDGSGADNENAPPPADSGEVVRGRIFLWAGFIIALLIFVTGVAGSIVLYRRRQE